MQAQVVGGVDGMSCWAIGDRARGMDGVFVRGAAGWGTDSAGYGWGICKAGGLLIVLFRQ